MSSHKSLLLLRRLQLLKRGSSNKSSSSLTTTVARPCLVAAPTTTFVCHKSSVSPAYRHDEEDDDENNRDHVSAVRRPSSTHFPSRILKQQAIQVQSPPLLETAPEEMQQADNTVSQDTTTASKSFVSPSQLQYTGDATIPITSRLHIVKPGEDTPRGTWPVFRLMVSICGWLYLDLCALFDCQDSPSHLFDCCRTRMEAFETEVVMDTFMKKAYLPKCPHPPSKNQMAILL